MKIEEAGLIKERSALTGEITYLIQTVSNISYKNYLLQNVRVYGINEAQIAIQPIKFEAGRYFSSSEFQNGAGNCIIGYTNAENLFGTAERAMGKQVEVKGKRVTIIGVIKKEGKSFIGWDYDNCIMLTNKFSRQIFEPEFSNPILIAKGKSNVSTDALVQEFETAVAESGQ